MAGALDPLRADLRPETVIRTARRLTASLVDVLADPGGGPPGHGPIADRLASAAPPPSPARNWSKRSTPPWC